MSVPYRYELWQAGIRLARYRTLASALLGAVWRSRKAGPLSTYIYVYKIRGGANVARVSA